MVRMYHCLTCHLLKDILVASICWLLQIKLLWVFMYRIFLDLIFYFSGIDAQEYNVRSYSKDLLVSKKLPSCLPEELNHL